MNRRFLLALLFLLLPTACSFEKVEKEIGHTGAARRDPFLAAQRFLEAREVTVNNVTRFGTGPDARGTLITPAQSFVNYGMTDQVMRWVQRGGHLIVFLRDGEAFRNDWLPFSLQDLKEPDPEVQRLLDDLGVDGVQMVKTAAKGTLLQREVEFEARATFSWKEGKRPRMAMTLGDADKPAVASFNRGYGHITIIASAKPFRNRHIGEGNNAWLLWLLTLSRETTEVWLLQGVRLSFFGMLWDHGWMAIVALLLLVGFWLWRHLPRFGPLRHAPDLSTRDFADHLRVIGAFQWKHRQAAALLAPLRDAVGRAAARRGWPPTESPGQENLAAVAGIPPARVQDAMQHEPRDPQAFLVIVQDLQKLATALRA